MHAKSLQSCLRLFAALWTITRQAPLSMGSLTSTHIWQQIYYPKGSPSRTTLVLAYKKTQECRVGSYPGEEFGNTLKWSRHIPCSQKFHSWVYVSMCSVTQSWPTLCNPMDCSLAGSSAHGILQARILEWVAISFSNISKNCSNQVWKRNV